MSGAERYLDINTVEGLGRLPITDSPFLAFAGPFDILFAAANTRRDVQHQLGAIPTGFIPIAVQGGNVQCFDVANWTSELAFLTADAINTRVRGFFVLTEVPTDA